MFPYSAPYTVVTSWPGLSLAFFAYVAVVAEWRRLPGRARWLAHAGSAAGAALAIAASQLPPAGPGRDLVVPAAVLLIAYWTTGLFFVRRQPRVEGLLSAIDERLRVDRIAAATPRLVAEMLEFAYSGVYPLVLIAWFLASKVGVPPDRFWSVVLLTDFVCFGTLPWIQTLPPRTLTGDPAWPSWWRRVNRRLVDGASVQANTFPSGHAAEAVAAALLVTGVAPAIAVAMFAAAAAVSAGAVLGRYHYAADALAGWLVALAVFYLLPVF